MEAALVDAQRTAMGGFQAGLPNRMPRSTQDLGDSGKDISGLTGFHRSRMPQLSGDLSVGEIFGLRIRDRTVDPERERESL
jgi:hypothetical protein